MSKLKQLAFAVATLALTGTANAAFYTLGPVGVSGSAPLEVALPDGDPFFDSFSFSLLSGSSVQFGLTSFFWGASAADLPGFSFSLTGGSGAGTYLPNVVLADDLVSVGQVLSGLQAGQIYTLTISGTESADLGQSYSLQAAALAVPEPAGLGLLLGGLGLMALARRRHLGK